MVTVAVVGSSGFVGGHTVRALEVAGVDVVSLPSVRLLSSVDRVRVGDAELRRDVAVQHLAEQMAPATVMLVAAGMAAPRSTDVDALFLANARLPGLIHDAARVAGLRRLVHVSSAVVQGRMATLDETFRVDPGTPYGRSKAAGERVLLGAEGIPEVTIYRPTSVMSGERGMTRDLIGITRLPMLPMVDGGNVPIPVAHIDNVAAALVHLCTTPNHVGPIALHPWEGHTVRSLLQALGWSGRAVGLRRSWVVPAFGLGWRAAAASPPLRARLRAVELLVAGQRQRAEVLGRDGFELRVAPDGYAQLTEAS